MGVTGMICLGSFAICSFYHKKVRKLTKKQKVLQQYESMTPFELKQKLVNQENLTWIKKNFKILSNKKVKGKVMLIGNVQCQKPIESIDKKSKLVYSISIRDKMFSNDDLRDDRKIKSYRKYFGDLDFIQQLNEHKQVQKFDLVDDNSFKSLVYIKNETDLNDGLTQITIKETLKQMQLLDHLLIFFSRAMGLIMQSSGLKFMKGVEIGIREEEIGIEVNSVLNVFGEIIYNFEKNTLKIKNPLYFFKDPTSLLKNIQNLSKNLKFVRNIFAGLTLVSFIYLIYLRDKLLKKSNKSPPQLIINKKQ